MKRALLAVLLGLGALGGFASGFHFLRHGGYHGHHAHRAELEAHVAELCTRAARKVQSDAASERGAPPP